MPFKLSEPMANVVLHESKTILKRVLIGLVTGVSGAAIIYFLGYNRSKKASELEIKQNTINTWKQFVDSENVVLVRFDSSLLRANRALNSFLTDYPKKDSALKVQRWDDSINFIQSITNLEKFRDTEDIDPDFVILLNKKIGYQKEQLENTLKYKTDFARIVLDSTKTISHQNMEVGWLNENYNIKMQNIVERVGRSIEDLATTLNKKYLYPFSPSDFRFYPFYLTLKKAKRPDIVKPEVAPPDPQQPAPDLPD